MASWLGIQDVENTFWNITYYSNVLFLKNVHFVLGDVCKGRCLFREVSAISGGALNGCHS